MANTVRRAWRWFVFPTPFLVAIVAWRKALVRKSGEKWRYLYTYRTARNSTFL